jgi:hypothetical protein
MSVDLSKEFEAPAPVDLAAEFETPAPAPDLAAEFDVGTPPAPKAKPTVSAAQMFSGGAFTLPPGTTLEQIQEAAGPVLDSVEAAAPTALRVGVPLVAIPFTGGMSIPAAVAIYGGASLAGDVAAQGLELATGQREEFSSAEAAINTAVGASVPALRAVPILKPLLAPGAKELVTGSRVARVAANVVEGATLSAGQDTAIRAARGEDITAGSVASSALYGAGFAGVLSTAFDEVARKFTLDRMFGAAREAGFAGSTVDDLRAWWQSPTGNMRNPAGQPIPVVPLELPAATAATPSADPTPSAATPGPAANSARAEFEARAGMAPAAPLSQVPTSGTAAAPAQPLAPKSEAGGSTPSPATTSAPENIDYAPWETDGGMPSVSMREDGSIQWVPPQTPEVQAILAAGRQPTTQIDPSLVPVQEFPLEQIVVNRDVPQFKSNANAQTGEVDPLQGSFQRLGTAPIVVWEKLNGEVEVITGRHRLALARRSGERTIPAQVVSEKAGFTRDMALTFDAESNIRDGQGEVKDYAAYFRTRGDISRDDAQARGLLRGAKGNSGWHLGRDAGDAVFSLYANGQLTEAKAVAISRGAPGHEAAQASALRQAGRMAAGELEMYSRNLAAMAPDASAGSAAQLGFEGISTDFASYEEAAAKIAQVQAARMRANSELLGAARGAAKNPGAAERMGLPVKDPEALRARVLTLEAENERLRNPDPALWAELHAEAGLPPPRTLSPIELDGPAPTETRPPEDTATMAMFEPGFGSASGDTLTPAQRAAVQATADQRVAARASNGQAALATRAKALRATSLDRPLSAIESAELDTLDRALGQEALRFDPPTPAKMVDDVKKGFDAAAKAEAERLQIQARAKAPLRAADLQTQGDMFDGPGQMALFERRRHSYDDPRQLGLDIGADLFALVAPPAPVSLKHSVGTHGALPLFGLPGAGGQGEALLLGAGQSGGPTPDAPARPGRGLSPDKRTRLELRGRAFASKLISNGKVTFLGAEARDADDIARLAQVLRNPRFETFYILGMKNGKVHAARAISSRVPFSTQIFAQGEDFDTYKSWLRSIDADEYYLLHNHPSSTIEASNPDKTITAQFAARVPGLRAHVIIDHSQYSVITATKEPSGRWRVAVGEDVLPGYSGGPDPLRTPDMPHPALGAAAQEFDTSAVIQYGKELGNQGQAVAVFFVQRDRITGVGVLPNLTPEALAVHRIRARLRGPARSVGAWHAVAYYDGGDPAVESRLMDLVADGALYDAHIGKVMPRSARWLHEAKRGWVPMRDLGLYRDSLNDKIRIMEGESLPAFDPRTPLLLRDGRRGTYWPTPLERLDKIAVVQMPELVRLARTLTGRIPEVRKLRQALGVFKGEPELTLQLDPRIFRDPSVAAKVLAHEIGHLADYLPDATMNRGNLLGRIASLTQYMANTLPLDPVGGGQALTPQDRQSLRRQAEEAIGKKPPADEEADRAAWNEAVAVKYAELLQDELETRGLIVNRGNTRGGTSLVGVSKSGMGIREELIAASEYWKPIPDGAPLGFVAYRHSAPELYADALSILLNSPGTLKRIAPTFYDAFFNYLDAKPEVKKALFETYDLLSKPHLHTLQRRSDDIQAMFVKGDELLLRKAAEREARYGSMRGWWDRFRQELFDTFDPLVARGAALERAGRELPARYNPRFLFDEHPLADNRNYEMVQRLWEKVVKPIEAADFTLHEFGEFLFLTRVLNERIVRAEPPASAVQAWQVARNIALRITDPVRRAEAVRDLDRKLSEWDVSQNVGRTGVANPLGTTPETARLGLLRMRLEAGSTRFGELERAAQVFHDTVFEQMQAAVEVGAYSQDLFDSVLAPNRDFYAAFGVLDYLEDYVPASVRMSEGTFKEIANPFTATVLKMVSVNRLIQTQKSKRGTVEFLETFDPANITPAARRFDGRGWVVDTPKDPDQGLLELLDDGQRIGYHVDKSVADMFEKLTPANVSAVLQVLNWPFRNIIYPLIIRYNPAFQLVLGPARDLRRTLVNVPRGRGVRMVGEFARNYTTFLGLPPTEAGAAVRAYLRGEPNDIIAEMIATQAIGTPLDNFGRDFGRGDAMEKILADFGMTPDKQRPGKMAEITKPVLSLLQAIEFSGLTFEMLPKVSTYRILTRELGWSRKEAAYFVRNSVGVPNINRKGRHTNVAEVVFPFFKVFANGLRADAKLARDPKSAGGWWFRWAATDGVWTMIQAAGALGLLGAGIKELYDGISDYNKTNYNVLPIGTTEGGEFGQRVVNIRMPRDETHRLISGLLYQGMMSAGRAAMGEEVKRPNLDAVTAFGADQLPGLNPIIEIGARWAEYLQGENPKDSFRGSPILTNAEWLAGGWPALKSMLAFTADNVGITNFVRYDPNANTTAEMVLSATPGLNRFIQSTATGYRERQQATQKAESAERARLRLSMPESVQRLAGEYYHLRSVPLALRTPEQQLRLLQLQRWHGSVYQTYEDVLQVMPKDPVIMRQLEEESKAYERQTQ